MKVFFVGLLIGLTSLSLSAQENGFYQMGESLISIRNPKLGIQGSNNEFASITGSHLDFGYFFKDRWLIGGGVQAFYSNLDGANNDGYYGGLQFFGRYYFSPLGKKKQFIFFAEPRIEGLRTFRQSAASGENFESASNIINIGAALHFAWRPRKRISFDIGLQSHLGWGQLLDPGAEIQYLGFSPLGVLSINFHL
ncbi:MAG: hypothetical protein AB8H47_01945 [Bacteroidia bacterium]